MKHIKRFLRALIPAIVYIISFFQSGCKKLVEIEAPTTSINAENVYSTDATAIAVLTGIYTKMSAAALSSSGPTSISFFTGLSGDELVLYSGSTNATYVGYYANGLTNVNTGNNDFWLSLYPIIYTANTAVERLTNNDQLTPAVKKQLLGEAKFIRAFCYFYLANLYGDLPLVLGTDYSKNSTLPRTAKNDVYQQIVLDLKDAKELLSASFLNGSLNPYQGVVERVRPTKWAASALLSRTYLFQGNWQNAETEASDLISSTNLFDTVSLSNVFTKASKEAIWQLQPVNPSWNTEDARLYILTGTPTVSRPVYLSTSLLSVFETGDNRKTAWIGSINSGGIDYYYPYKYKSATLGAPVTEYEIVFRLAEQYLIRAEARAKLGKINEAKQDINILRTRAGLLETTANNEASLLTAIRHERQVELFTEWGDRWLDIKRTGTVDSVMNIVCPQKGGQWQNTDQLYPIPLSELRKAPQLVQNPGY